MARTGTSSSPSPSWRRRRPLRRQPRREPLRCARPPCSCCTRRRSFAASRSGSSTRRGAGSSARTRCGAPQPLVASCARVRVFSLTDLPSAARGRQEGLTSLPGYLAVWWLGDAIGALLRPRAAARSWWRTLAELGLLTLVLGAGAPRTPRPALASPRARPALPPTRAECCSGGRRLTPGLAPFAAWCAQHHLSPMRRCSGRRDGCATWPTRSGSSRRRAAPSPAARPRAQQLCLLATGSLGTVHLSRYEPRLSRTGSRPLGRVESPPAGRFPSCQLAYRRGQPDAAYHAREWALWDGCAVRLHGGGLCRHLRG